MKHIIWGEPRNQSWKYFSKGHFWGYSIYDNGIVIVEEGLSPLQTFAPDRHSGFQSQIRKQVEEYANDFGVEVVELERTLPQGQFTYEFGGKRKKDLVLVSGRDFSERCLFMIATGLEVYSKYNNARVLKTVRCKDWWKFMEALVVLFDPLEANELVLRSVNKEVATYTWNGKVMIESRYTPAEWDFKYKLATIF